MLTVTVEGIQTCCWEVVKLAFGVSITSIGKGFCKYDMQPRESKAVSVTEYVPGEE